MATTEEILGQYQRERITMSSPEALTLMLYEAALKNVRQMRENVDLKAIELLSQSQRARDILLALADTVNLDHPHGQTMRDLYLYCWRTVITAPGQDNAAAEFMAVETVLENLIRGLQGYLSGERASEKQASEVSSAPMTVDFAG